jgi:hypothetical protein
MAMSTTFTPSGAAVGADGPAAPVRPGRGGPPQLDAAAPRLATPPRRKTPLGRLAFGLTVVVFCGGLLAVLFAQAQQRQPVLAVARPVAAGEAITDADLAVAQVSADGLVTVPASARAQVVGRIAAVDLRPGMNLTPDALTGTPVPPPGQAVLGVLFKPGQLPGRELVPGDRVLLVTTAAAAGRPAAVVGVDPTAPGGAASSGIGTGTGAGSPAGTTREARVVAVTPVTATGDGSVVVDLLVGEAEGPAVAADAAAGHLALLLLPRAG